VQGAAAAAFNFLAGGRIPQKYLKNRGLDRGAFALRWKKAQEVQSNWGLVVAAEQDTAAIRSTKKEKTGMLRR
jgi:hypothetical protein